MKILFIGGTGIISTACAQLAVQRGLDLSLLNRGKRKFIPGTRAKEALPAPVIFRKLRRFIRVFVS